MASRPLKSSEQPDLSTRLHEVPHQPGVYLMRDRLDKIIYIGKARDLRKRVSNYFMPSRRMTADLKTRALIQSIWDFEFHVVRSEPEAILLEGRLIKEYRPKYNISFRDDKRFLMLKVNFNDPFPRFQLTRAKKDDGARYFGPFPHSGALRTTLNWVKKRYGLRTCRPLVPGEADYKHCHNDVIKNCSAPCILRVTKDEYRERVNEACGLFEGSAKEPIRELRDEMHKAAEKMDFERAAELRDMVEALKRTTKPMRRFTHKMLPTVLDTQEDLRALGDALGMPAPPQVMECFDISNISTTHIVASMVCFRNGEADRANYRRYRIRTVKGQDDFASMGEVIRRRYSRVLLESKAVIGDDAVLSQEAPGEMLTRVAKRLPSAVRLPSLVIVDGGKGQLSTASKELQRLGLHDLPIIGLAKQNEEIFRPARPLPLQLPHDSGALKLLQRIRDEAHRFANGYHQLLMKRRMGESILDDCPGISPRRKEILLKTFGSIQRIRKLTAEEIVTAEGIGPKLASDLVAYLATH